MYDLRKLLLSLDLSELDNHLIPYGFHVASLMGSQEVILMHVLSSKPKKKGALPATRQEVEQYMDEKVRHFKSILPASVQVRIEVPSGDPLTELLEFGQKESIDLLVVGRKNITEGTGETSRKLARRALCSILRVPENASQRFKRILIPIDFSEFSVNALKRAIDLSHRVKDVEIMCLNIYELPNGYLASGKTEEEYAEIMQENARKRYKHFIKQFDMSGVNVTANFCLDRSGSTRAQIITNIALRDDADLIVMGSRGRTSIAAALLGSTTEKVLLHNLTVPMLILKSKQQNLGFFDALFNI